MESLEAPDGYVCVVPDSDEMLSVTGVEVHVGFLDDLIVNYREALLQQVHITAHDLKSYLLTILGCCIRIYVRDWWRKKPTNIITSFC